MASSSWQENLRTSRRQLELDLLSSPQRRYFSPIYYGQYQVTLPLMRQFVKGRLLDLGCGDLPFQDELKDRVSCYHTLDLFPRRSELTYVCDVQDMNIVPGESYDSVVCLEVLEHVPDPFRAAREIYRVMAPGGILILSVPHLSRLHEEPHDYYRYTRYGLNHLLEQAGLQVIHLQPRGSLFTFLGHQVATVVLGQAWSIVPLRKVAWFLNSWLITRLCYRLDRLLDRPGIFAAGYTVVAQKLESGH